VDIDGLCAEHLQFCHPSISVILGELFNMTLLCTYVPSARFPLSAAASSLQHAYDAQRRCGAHFESSFWPLS